MLSLSLRVPTNIKFFQEHTQEIARNTVTAMTTSTRTPRPTLKAIPPMNPELSLLENNLELSALEEMGDGVFTNTRPLWKPDDARGIYGGCVSVSRRQLGSCIVAYIANKDAHL